MTEETAHLSFNVPKKLANALNGSVFLEKIEDKSFSKKKLLEEIVFRAVVELGHLNKELEEELKKELNIE